MERLDGKVAVVTGAGGGLGRAHALRLAAEGARVVVNDLGGARDGSGGGQVMADGVVGEILQAGGQALASYESVSEPDSAERILQTAIAAYGRLDILVNNAGILRDKTLLKMDDAMWEQVRKVHLDGTFYCGRAAARLMAEAGEGGRIINTSSVSGLMGNFGQSNYGAAKAGIAGLTRVWAMELARHGITVNAIAPVAATRMTSDISRISDDLRPEMVSQMVLFLAGDLSGDVTGRIFGVHGRQIFEYKMQRTDGVTRETDWTPEEILEALPLIGGGAHAEHADADSPAVAAAFEKLGAAFDAGRAGDWRATFHYVVRGGQDHTVQIDSGRVSIRQGLHGLPSCTVRVGGATLVELVEGRTTGQRAFLAGQIKADDMQEMRRFDQAFRLPVGSGPPSAPPA